MKILETLALAALVSIATPARAQSPILGLFSDQTMKQERTFEGFSAERGRAFFLANRKTGKPATPSCSSCHTKNPLNAGRTRAGKVIAPMALSATPTRFSELKKVEKWFRRNCKSVLGRPCTPLEKGDFLTFMMSR